MRGTELAKRGRASGMRAAAPRPPCHRMLGSAPPHHRARPESEMPRAEPLPAAPPFAIVVMGVSGSGKTTVGAALAARLGVGFRDADEFHPAANVAKMSAGTPLTDEDRWPWLDAIGAALAEAGREGRGIVVGCSALKRIYRDRL